MSLFSNLQSSNNTLTFELKNKNIKISLSNALRRIILSEIPMFSIDYNTINFSKNTSMLHDEFLARRLVLFPINYDIVLNNNIEEIEISLTKKNEEDHMIDILSKDFKVNTTTKELNNLFFSEDILFGKLKPGQEIILNCKLTKKIAKYDGPQFCPVSVCPVGFKRDDNKINEMLKEMNQEINEENKEEIENKKKEFMMIGADRIYLKNEKGEPQVYIFKIESVSELDSKKIFLYAIEVLKNKLNNLKSALNDNKTEKISLKRNEKNFKSYDFLIIDEDHTLGNLLNSYLVDNQNINYSGYLIPHPNDNKLIITTAVKENNKLIENKKIFQDNIDYILKIIDDIENEWKTILNIKDVPVKKLKIKKSPKKSPKVI